jgi:hypothetical protein
MGRRGNLSSGSEIGKRRNDRKKDQSELTAPFGFRVEVVEIEEN